jgi:hypothetical protein
MVLLLRDTKKDNLLNGIHHFHLEGKIFESIGIIEMLGWKFCFDYQSTVYYDFIPEGKTVNKYTDIIRRLRDFL